MKKCLNAFLMLEPDPYPCKMNTEPQPCYYQFCLLKKNFFLIYLFSKTAITYLVILLLGFHYAEAELLIKLDGADVVYLINNQSMSKNT
jgi:hypothetical protein